MITRYVNTESTSGGNGTTNDITGDNRAWSNLQEACTAVSGASFADNLEILCCGLTADSSIPVITGAVVQPGYTCYIKGNPNHINGRHNGVYNTTKYRLDIGSSVHGLWFQTANDQIFIIDGIQIIGSASSYAIDGGYARAGWEIRNCIIFANPSSSLIRLIPATTGLTFNFINSIAIRSNLSSTGYIIEPSGSYGVKIYNSIVGYGYAGVAGGVNNVIKNSSFISNVINFLGGSGTVDYCATSTGEGSNPVTVENWSAQFLDASYASHCNFNLSRTSILLSAGIGPEQDALVPTTDIVLLPRSGLRSTIGPFEQSKVKPNTKIDYRFIKTADISGLEDDGSHGTRIKLKSDGGLTLNSDGLSIDKSFVNETYIGKYTITASDVTSKSFKLNQSLADTNQMSLTVMGGPHQQYGTDYTTSDSTTISWSGLGLDGVMLEGDVVQLRYPT